MSYLETFSTSAVAEPRRRLELWNAVASKSFTPLISQPHDLKSFSGSLARTRVGNLHLAQACSGPQTVHHLRSHVLQSREVLFFLEVQLEGEAVVRQLGRECRLRPGDFTLCDSAHPYELLFETTNRMLIVGIPEALMRWHIGCPEMLLAVPMSGSSGTGALLAEFLRCLWKRGGNGLEAIAVPRVQRMTLDLIAATYSTLVQAQAGRTSLSLARRMRIISYIEEHLFDPRLTPTSIAHACKMTPRYLHQLFSDTPESVSKYVLRRRLEECSRLLRTPAAKGMLVSQIAFRLGFNNATHFSRVFREHYHLSPREYRRAQLSGTAAGQEPQADSRLTRR